MKKIKILHIYKSFYPETIGGIENFIDLLSSELNQQFEFGLFCIGETTKFYDYKNIKVYKFKKTFEFSSCPFSFDALINFKKIFNEYDILHYHYPFPFMDILNLFVSKKKIVTYHSDIVKQNILNFFYKPLQKKFLQDQDLIIATSKEYLNSSETLKYYKKKTKIIYLGIKRPKATFSLKLKKNKYILFVGALRYYKGLDVLLKAAKKINCKIYICGSGAEINNLLLLKKSLKLDNVHFFGYVSEKMKYKMIKNCELFVFPSNLRSEAFGFSLLEAMSLAIPVISCEIGTATSFININNKTGFVISPNNSDILAEKVNFLLDPKNYKIKKKFSQQAYLRFTKYFRSQVMTSNYLKVYKDLYFSNSKQFDI